MRALKFSVVDILKCKVQLIFLVLFGALAFWFMTENDNIIMGMLYMCFASVILSIQPFMQEQMEETGFINMLPLTKKERIAGRYIFGAMLVVAAMLLASLATLLYKLVWNGDTMYWMELMCCCIGIALLVIGLQYMLYFGIGKFKSQQLAGIIMMIPGFVLFFGGSALIETLVIDAPELLKWILEHARIISVGVLVAGVVVWALAIQGAYMLIRNRDMN